MTAIENTMIKTEKAVLPARAAASPSIVALRQFARSPSGVIGAVVLLLLILFTVFGAHIYAVDPLDIVSALHSAGRRRLPRH